MTEFTNINSLADHHIWSTIKTLPATLPEPSSVVRGPSFEAQGPSFTDHCPASVDHGPGLLEPFLPHMWISVRGWGRIMVVGTCALSLGSRIGGGGGG